MAGVKPTSELRDASLVVRRIQKRVGAYRVHCPGGRHLGSNPLRKLTMNCRHCI